MGVDGSCSSGSFTEVSNMIANLEKNRELFETITSRASRATFARTNRKATSTERLEKSQNNLYEKVLETNLKERKSSSSSWTVEEIPLNPRQSKNLMETLNESPLNLTVSIQDETDEAVIRSESVKSDESVTILNELYETNPKSETEDYSSDKRRTPIQNHSKKLKFDALIPNSIKNMFLSTKRSQTSNSLYEEEKPKKTSKSRKPHHRHETDSNSSSSPVVATPPMDSNIDNESIVSNWISLFESVENLQQLLKSQQANNSTSTSNHTTQSPCISMNGKEFIELIRISYQNLCKSNLNTLNEKIMYAFVSTLISMELLIESTPSENQRKSLASNLCQNESNLFESLMVTVNPERINQEKERLFTASLQLHQITCQLSNVAKNHSQINNTTSSDDCNEQELNTDKNMLLQRRESKLLLSFEEFLSVNNNCKMGSSLSQEDGTNSTIYKAEALEDEQRPIRMDSSSSITTNEMSTHQSKETSTAEDEENVPQTTTTDLAISNSAANFTLLANLGSNVSNHVKQPSNNSNCNNTSSTTISSITPSSSNEEISNTPTLPVGPSPYELKLKIGDKTLSELKQQLKDRKHRYGFLTPTQFLEFGLRAGFDEEEFASIYAVTYSTLMSAHQLIPQMQYIMKIILNDEKLPIPLTGEEEEDDEDPNKYAFLEDDCKLTKEEKNNVVGRVARFLKQFVLLSFSDFQYDKQFHEILYSFVAPLIGFIDFEASNGALVQEQVVDLVERITLVISGAHEDQFCQTEEAPKPLIKKLPTDPRKMNLVDIDPVEIARQLTLFEFSSFEKLSAKELLGASWMKDSKEWTAPNVTQLIWRSNQLTDWVSTFICSITNLKDRKKALKHLIHVADACLEIHNYNTVFEIVMGLISQPVYRLKKTWEVLKENDLQRVWKRLEDITSFPGNRRVYRDQIQKVIKESVVKMTPCLPYLGVHLSDLVFFDEGNKDSMEKGVTTFYNCTKRSCMGQIVYQIIAVKKIPYNFQKVDLIEQFIWWQFNSKVLHDENERDKLSKKCE